MDMQIQGLVRQALLVLTSRHVRATQCLVFCQIQQVGAVVRIFQIIFIIQKPQQHTLLSAASATAVRRVVVQRCICTTACPTRRGTLGPPFLANSLQCKLLVGDWGRQPTKMIKKNIV